MNLVIKESEDGAGGIDFSEIDRKIVRIEAGFGEVEMKMKNLKRCNLISEERLLEITKDEAQSPIVESGIKEGVTIDDKVEFPDSPGFDSNGGDSVTIESPHKLILHASLF
jgi:hypothetical protein